MSIYLNRIDPKNYEPQQGQYFLYYDENKKKLCVKTHDGLTIDDPTGYRVIKFYEKGETYDQYDFVYDPETTLYFCLQDTLADTPLTDENFYKKVDPNDITPEELKKQVDEYLDTKDFINIQRLNEALNFYYTKKDVDNIISSQLDDLKTYIEIAIEAEKKEVIETVLNELSEKNLITKQEVEDIVTNAVWMEDSKLHTYMMGRYASEAYVNNKVAKSCSEITDYLTINGFMNKEELREYTNRLIRIKMLESSFAEKSYVDLSSTSLKTEIIDEIDEKKYVGYDKLKTEVDSINREFFVIRKDDLDTAIKKEDTAIKKYIDSKLEMLMEGKFEELKKIIEENKNS